MRYSNCLIWAISQFIKHGGYISFRRGVGFGGWYLHFLWAKELSGPWYSYSVDYQKAFPWPLFTGEIIEGDPVRDMQEGKERLADAYRHVDGLGDEER